MIFVDTWAWVALALKRDQHHQPVTVQHKAFQRARRAYVTTDFVLSELIAHLYTTLTADQAQRFINNLLRSTDDGTYRLVHVSPQQFRQAWELRQKYQDKPDISFIDFTSFVVMRDLGITDVFTGDAHFGQVGMGFRLAP
jgi:uncharacterized protein